MINQTNAYEEKLKKKVRSQKTEDKKRRRKVGRPKSEKEAGHFGIRHPELDSGSQEKEQEPE